jgi:hypothetical protein
MFAFTVVAVACVVIMANGARSQAFVSTLRASAQHVVHSLSLAPAHHEPARSHAPEPVRVVAAPTHPERGGHTDATAPGRRALAHGAGPGHAEEGRSHGHRHRAHGADGRGPGRRTVEQPHPGRDGHRHVGHALSR